MFESDDGGGDHCRLVVDLAGNRSRARGDELDRCVDDRWYDYCVPVAVAHHFGGAQVDAVVLILGMETKVGHFAQLRGPRSVMTGIKRQKAFSNKKDI